MYEFIERIPYELTGAQMRVIREISNDMESPSPMQRLVQGDVGSGKTVVAAGRSVQGGEERLSGCDDGADGTSGGAASENFSGTV